jgi:PBP1b-binding outer membrane lipoprotein LpoB
MSNSYESGKGAVLIVGLVLFVQGCSQPPTTHMHMITSEAVVTGRGPLDSSRIDQYQTLAVLPFEDAPHAPDTGIVLTELVSNELLNLGFTLVERSRLKKLLEEQRLELRYGDDRQTALHVGRLAGAKAIVMGRVDRWPQMKQDEAEIDASSVAFSLELVDVETGTILYGGQAAYSRPLYVQSPPEHLAHILVRNWVTQLGIDTGLTGTGITGFQWILTKRGTAQVAVVTHIEHGLPAEAMELRVGDIILACNNAAAVSWQTLWESLRACQIDAGRILTLTIQRGSERLLIGIRAVDRMALSENMTRIPL